MKHYFRRFCILMICLLSSMVANAWDTETDLGVEQKTTSYDTSTEYMEFWVCYYNVCGKDSYIPGGDYFEVWYDGEKIGSTRELSGEDNDDRNSGGDKVYSTRKATQKNGMVDVEIYKHKSGHSGNSDERWAQIRIFPAHVQYHGKHIVKFAANYKINQDEVKFFEKSFTVSVDMPGIYTNNTVMTSTHKGKNTFKGRWADTSCEQEMTLYKKSHKTTVDGKTANWGYASYSSNSNDYYARKKSSGNTANQNVEIEFSASNYNPVMVYPRNLITGKKAKFHDKVDGAYTVHYPKATGLQVTTDYWNKTVMLKWDKKYSLTSKETLSTDGKWMITRRTGSGSFEYVKHVDYDKEEYTIPASFGTEYDKHYTYAVSFVPKSWGTDYQASTSDLLSMELTDSCGNKMEREFNWGSIVAEQSDTYINLSWTCTAIALNQQTEFKVYRVVNGKETEAGTVATEKNKDAYSFSDEIGNLADQYSYYVEIEMLDTKFTSPVKEARLSGNSHVYDLMATKGAYNDNVTLIWKVEQLDDSNTYFKVERRVHSNFNEDAAEWKLLANLQGQDDEYTYVDTKAQNGIFYDYRVTSYCKNSNKEVSCVEYIEDLGFCSQTGTISGKIAYSGGIAVDSVRVMLERASADGDDRNFEASLNCGIDFDGMLWKPTADVFTKAFGNNAYALQMYAFPGSTEQSPDGRLFRIGDSYVKLGDYDAEKGEFHLKYGKDANYNSNLTQNPHKYIHENTIDVMSMSLADRREHNHHYKSIAWGADWVYVSTLSTGAYLTFDLFNKSHATTNLAVAIKLPSNAAGYRGTVYVENTSVGYFVTASSPKEYVENNRYYVMFHIPDSLLVDADGNVKEKLGIKITGYGKNSTSRMYEARLVQATVSKYEANEVTIPGITVPQGKYSHLSFSVGDGKLNVTRIHKFTKNPKDLVAYDSIQTASINADVMDTKRNSPTVAVGEKFQGFIDDVRVFNRALTPSEIRRDYNHFLSGKEKGLICYWPFDDGIQGTGYAYDHSFTAGDANNNHAIVMAGCELNGVVPKTSELSFSAVTDANGDYIIQGVPYFDGGTNYRVRPELGIHDFSPATKTCYFSDNSLVYGGSDFTDQSSFPVNGVVFYEGTNHPVEGLTVYIDEAPAIKDGAIVTTGKDGTFDISVPIGNHYIQVKQLNHDLMNQGRWPETGTHLFDREVRDLTFTDQTLVTVAGRIDGGAIEYDKPLGMGVSENNIGQAVITLTSEYYLNAAKETTGLSSIFVPARTEREFTSPTPLVESTARTGKDTEAGVKTITITTDPATGEFAVQLPPVNYEIKSITVPSNPDLVFQGVQFPVMLSATNVDVVYTDSLQDESQSWRYFDYKTKYKLAYRTKPVVSFNQKGNPAGVYGVQTYEYKYIAAEGADPVYKEFPLLNYNEATKEVKYTFNDAPVFYQNGRYAFNIEGYEPYVNHDGGKNKEFKVPLDKVTVNVSNEMSIENFLKYDTGEILKVVDGHLNLDSLGRGTYEFIAGYPRAQAPYTLGLSLTYKAGDVNYSWDAPGFADKKFKGIVLGQLPYGNSFVTAGTDKLLMVLRDPPGSRSSMTWNQSVTTKNTTKYDSSHSFEEHSHQENGVEIETKFQTGSVVGGVLTGTITSTSSTKTTAGISLTATEGWGDNQSHDYSFTTSRAISTSSDPMYDGPDADLYIGISRNYLFGTAKKVGLRHQADDTMTLGAEDILTMGDSLETTFAYTQYYIINTLIPEYKMMRNRMILPMGTHVNNNEKYYMYVSDVPDDDPNFGRPGYYHTVGGVVEKDKALVDSVSWCNVQIATWEENIRQNEWAKVTAISQRDSTIINNYSLSSGASITDGTTEANSGAISTNVQLAHTEDLTVNFETAPFGHKVKNAIGYGLKSNHVWTTTVANDTIEAFTFTLVDGDPEDALTIDVLESPDGFSPIFYTRAGQTSGNWEPQQLTQYYDPGKHEIMAQTMKNMVPKIYGVTSTQVTNVPINGKALIKVTLCNESETNVGGLFKLGVGPNPQGCQVRCQGGSLTGSGLGYYLGGQYGQVDVTIEVSATDMSQLECEFILRLTDATQSDPLGPYPRNSFDLPIKVTFVPASSEIALEADRAILNGNDDGKVSFTLKDYDLNLDNLMNISLEYRGESDSNWKTYSAWSCNPSDKSSETVLDQSSVVVALDMTDTKTFPDQTYHFRARTMSDFGGEKVYNYSDELSVLKDIVAPRLIGNPSPSDGTYRYNTEVCATFNEDIRSELVTKLDNISLIGQLNDGKISHEVSLQCNGDPYCTEAKLPMPNTTFSINMWVKWSGGTGSIFAHGTTSTNLAIGTASEENNYRFYMKLGKELLLSDKQLPKDEWVFLSVVYDATDEDNRKILCDYASANSDEPVSLIAKDEVGPVTFTAAKITMGYEFHGNIHDFSIWNNARPFSVANSQKDKRLSKFAPNLVAYWPLTEGHGSVANENLHEANLVLEGDNCWHLENENYSLRLESQDRVRIVPSGNATTDDTEDYLLQVWMRADENQDAAGGDGEYATVLSMDNDRTALLLDRQTGSLALRYGDGAMATVTGKDMRDGKWHHLALMAHKSTNANATLYLDGNNVGHVSAAQVSNVTGPIYIGGGFSGNVDEIRIVKGMFTESTIKESMYVRYDTGNSRMLLYYPFEVTEADAYGQPATTFSPVDRGVYAEGENRMVAAYADRTHDPLSCSGTVAPPLLSTPIMQNVKYDLVVSNRRVAIDITESPERIEGCTLVASIRNIRDKAGNVMEPVTWLFNVKHDFIGWKEKVINESISVDENMTDGVSIKKHIRNNTGLDKEWSLESVPYWMIPSQTGGVLQPNEELAVTFNVLPSIGKGLHTGVIYLVEGATGISHPINYELINHRDIPEWKVNKESYSNTMNIIGQVSADGTKQEGVYNMVGAFNTANECVGVATPTYEPRYDAYYYYLTIYGGDASDSSLRFAYYDSQTGIVYPDVDILMPAGSAEKDCPVKFVPNRLIGSHAEPLLWQPNSKIEQTILVNAGWNWISFNTMGTTPLDELFGEMTASHDEELPVCTEIVNEESFSQFDAETNAWNGMVTGVEPGTMYKVRMGMPNRITRIGEPANDKRLTHTIQPGWNWLGATVSNSISLTSAMADMNPEEGDMIKNYETMSYFAGGGWVGPLKNIVPGVGYYYHSADPETKDFVYPTKAALVPYAMPARSVVMKGQATRSRKPSVTDYPARRKYTGTMTMVASIRSKDIAIGNAELQAYDADGELRGINVTQDADDRHLVYIVLHGDEVDELTFCVLTGEGDDTRLIKCSRKATFEDGTSLGTAANPFVIDINDATPISNVGSDEVDGPIYDISGRRVFDTKASGIYIQNNRKIAK